jgi:hypothetical protein
MGSRSNVPRKGMRPARLRVYIVAMPTYIYETTDPAKPARTFEVRQSVHDEPLRKRPENWRRSAACDVRWLTAFSFAENLLVLRSARSVHTEPRARRVAGHFPTVNIFCLWNHFAIW